MTVLVYILALTVVARAGAVVDLNCSDNATCIEGMAKDFVRSLRQQKAVRLFNVLTIEPMTSYREARSRDGVISRFLKSHAFTFDWSDFSFRFSKPQNRNDAIALEVFQGRSATTGIYYIDNIISI